MLQSEVLKIQVLNHIFRGAIASGGRLRHRSQITVFIENLRL
jgi:hypothetical protein